MRSSRLTADSTFSASRPPSTAASEPSPRRARTSAMLFVGFGSRSTVKSLQKSRRQKAIRAAFLSLCLSCCCCDKTSPRLRFLWARHAVGRQGTPRAASPLVAAAAALFRRQRENRRESLTDEAGSIVVVETIDGIKKKKLNTQCLFFFSPLTSKNSLSTAPRGSTSSSSTLTSARLCRSW